MRRLRVLVLMHQELVPPDSLEGHSEEEINRWKMEFDVLATLERLGHEVRALGVEDEILPIRQAISGFRPHLCFNLLMHFHDAGVYDSAIVSWLELMKMAYTGCNPRGLLLAGDKALSKKILTYHRIRTPRFLNFARGRVMRAMPKNLRFPLIVKSTSEHASTGISQASIVRNEDALRERVEFVHSNVGTAAIAEEYIVGRELTVGVLGNKRLEVFPVWEMFFDSLPDSAPANATSRVKWDKIYQKKIGLRTGPAEDLEPELDERIQKTAKRVYKALELSGYGRVDLRLDEDGQPWVLEANPNPDLC
ncbi:MAG: ATP-grasp domain-containing protein, partial [Planctomycetota bacterium]|nr:ATP-grasp domain-containing protein [Planctomycetota bacterium]